MEIIPNNGDFPGVPPGLPVGAWAGCAPHAGDELRLVAMGDLGLSGSVGHAAARAAGARALFGEIAPALQAADGAMANLETPLIDNWSPERLFAGDARWAADLRTAGFTVLHLASNHMLDHGAQGFAQTIEAVRRAGIVTLGVGATPALASSLVVHEVRGRRIGWLAAGHTNLHQPPTPRLYELVEEDLLRQTERARTTVDLLMLSVHWGPMLVDYPYLEQRQLARRLVDAGASAVLMHHAHILQGVEVYAGTPICYSLGNCIFDPDEGLLQRASTYTPIRYPEQLTTCVFSLAWSAGRFSRVLAAPVQLPSPREKETDHYRLAWATPESGRTILDRLRKVSDDLSSDFAQELNRQLWAVRTWGLHLHLHLVLRRGEIWRLGYLARRFRFRHLRSLLRTLFSRST